MQEDRHTCMYICVCTHITYQSISLIVTHRSISLIVTHHYIFEEGKEECGGDSIMRARAVLILLKKKIQVPILIIVVQLLSCVRLFVTSWTVACQGPLSMGFPKQEY